MKIFGTNSLVPTNEFGNFPPNLIQQLLQGTFLFPWQRDFPRQVLPDKRLRTYAKCKLNFELEKYLIVRKEGI